MADIENLKFNGSMVKNGVTLSSGKRYLKELTVGAHGNSRVIVDFSDETPGESKNDEPGIYLQENNNERIKLDLSPENETKIVQIAGALANPNVEVNIEYSESSYSYGEIPLPFDMEVVDVNKDGKFTGQDLLDAVSQSVMNVNKTNNGPAR